MWKPCLVVAALGLLAAGCVYDPLPEEEIRINDRALDVSYCRRLGSVSGTEPTGPTFEPKVTDMLRAVVAKGGTDLLLERRVRGDWSYVHGTAYRCPDAVRQRPRPRAVISVRG